MKGGAQRTLFVRWYSAGSIYSEYFIGTIGFWWYVAATVDGVTLGSVACIYTEK